MSEFSKDDFTKSEASSPPHNGELERLWPFCSNNQFAYSGSATAGCFYCCEIWEPASKTIVEWVDCEREAEDGIGNATVMCPFCGIDSVITSIDVGEITEELLMTMNEYWF